MMESKLTVSTDEKHNVSQTTNQYFKKSLEITPFKKQLLQNSVVSGHLLVSLGWQILIFSAIEPVPMKGVRDERSNTHGSPSESSEKNS